MKDDNPILSISPDHPLYTRLLKLIGWEKFPDEGALETDRVIKDANINWNQLTEDYNGMRVQGMLSFLVLGHRMDMNLTQALKRRGLAKKIDYLMFVAPVLAIESIPMLAAAPMEEIPEGEFASFACVKANPYPDPEEHPHVSAMDKAIPRRSNRHLTSDTLPVLQGMNQVYILKLSSREAKKLQKQGRPWKGSA